MRGKGGEKFLQMIDLSRLKLFRPSLFAILKFKIENMEKDQV
jgi:hypothetical protein